MNTNENTAKPTDPIWDSRNSDEPPKSDTPRTDSNSTYRDGTWECVDADFARTLERELSAALNTFHAANKERWAERVKIEAAAKILSTITGQPATKPLHDLATDAVDLLNAERAANKNILHPANCGVAGHFRFQENGGHCMMCQDIENKLAAERAAKEQAVAKCEEYEHAARVAASETCTRGEAHCACVPLLRTTIAQQGLLLSATDRVLRSHGIEREISTESIPCAVEKQMVRAEQAEKSARWQAESLESFRAKFNAKSNCEALDAIDSLKQRADDAEKELERLREELAKRS